MFHHQVLLVWDSVRNMDVGWWTVPAGSSLSLQHPVFQLRDVRLNCNEEKSPRKEMEEVSYQERQRSSSTSQDRSRMQEATNTDNIAIKDIHQQACGGSHLFSRKTNFKRWIEGAEITGSSSSFWFLVKFLVCLIILRPLLSGLWLNLFR